MSRYIDADALKKDIARLHVLNDEAEIRRAYEYNPHVTSTDFEETLVSVFDVIEDAPSIDIEPKRGEWIEINKEVISIPIKWSEADKRKPIYKVKFRCSECGFQKSFIDWHTAQYNFCPNCGADMREREGE